MQYSSSFFIESKMTEIQRIKFFVMIPSIAQGQLTSEVKSTTFIADGRNIAVLRYQYDKDLLAVSQTSRGGETKHFIYKMSDVMGRIEVDALEN